MDVTGLHRSRGSTFRANRAAVGGSRRIQGEELPGLPQEQGGGLGQGAGAGARCSHRDGLAAIPGHGTDGKGSLKGAKVVSGLQPLDDPGLGLRT